MKQNDDKNFENNNMLSYVNHITKLRIISFGNRTYNL